MRQFVPIKAYSGHSFPLYIIFPTVCHFLGPPYWTNKMPASNVQCPDFVIPNGSNISNVLDSALTLDDAEAIALYGLNTTDGAITYTMEVNPNPKAGALGLSTGWQTLQIGDPAGDAAPPLQGKARVYYENACVGALRIKASGNVTANRTWNVTKSIYL